LLSLIFWRWVAGRMLPFVGEVCTDSSNGVGGEDEEEAPADCTFSSLLTLSIPLDPVDLGLKRGALFSLNGSSSKNKRRTRSSHRVSRRPSHPNFPLLPAPSFWYRIRADPNLPLLLPSHPPSSLCFILTSLFMLNKLSLMLILTLHLSL
jgi:hypothetical protein